MSLIAGIDFNSRQADIILLNENSNHATLHTHPFANHGDAFDRARTIRDTLPTRGWWTDTGIIAIGIEDPRGAARNVDSILYRVQGAILASLPVSLLVQPWKPQEWRKQLAISHKGKQAPADYALEHWQNPPALVTQDALDAYCIAMATRMRIVRSQAA